MSNYPSLSRVLSPFRVQAKFEENSLPASPTLNPKRYIVEMSLFFVVLEHPLPNPSLVDIAEVNMVNGKPVNKEDLTTTHLKDMIWDAIKNSENDTNKAHRLTLWKIEDLREDTTKWQELTTLVRSYTETKIEELGGKKLPSTKKFIASFPDVPEDRVHILVQPPSSPATTGPTYGSLSIPMKRPGEDQMYNREPVVHREREFWNELSKANIVLKLPDDADKTIYMSEPLSSYMKVEGNEIVLCESVMLNSQNELILCDGSSAIESEKIIMDFVKFLRLRKSPNGIVYGIPNQDILIKKSYLQMIEKIELDRAGGTKGCMIIGSPGIGKTHFSLYLAFYITRRYNSDDIMYEQQFQNGSRLLHIKSNGAVMEISNPKREDPQDCFYIVDSVVPAPWDTKYTFLVTTPKRDLWHNLVKIHPRRYYAPVWSEEEIWNVWNHQYKNKISETRVKELINKWGYIPRRVFVEYKDEPDLNYLVTKVDVYKFLKNDGGDLDDDYTGKIIHIIPNADFTNKKYVPGSAEICKALYRYYESRTKEVIINVIRDFARGDGGTLAGNFFEMLAHDVLRKGGRFNIRRLTGDNNKQPEQPFDLQGLESNRFDDVQEINSGYYNFPKIKNLESVDAIAPECNGVHNLYQMTTAGKHSTKVNGLLKLANHLGGNLPIRLYFVVPDINNIFDNFQYQNYVTTKDTIYVGWNLTNEWIRDEIEQYVLEIKLDPKNQNP